VTGVNIGLGIVGAAAVGVICHQYFIYRRLSELECITWEIYDLLEKDVVEEKFQDIAQRFDEE
jgi:hypothetical protein